MERIRDTLLKLFLTLTILIGLNYLLVFFNINLGIENKYLIWPAAALGLILYFYFFGCLIVNGPEYYKTCQLAISKSAKKTVFRLRSLFRLKIFKYFFLPLVLFIGGLFLSTLFNVLQNEMQSVLIKRHPKDAFAAYQLDELLPGKVASVVFTADENNLGSVGVKFNTDNRINDDILEFRLKEEAKTDWIYVNEYKTDQFQNNKFFPFGFPKIPDSKGTVYLFEIESLQGTEDNAVSLSKKTPIIESRYQFALQEIASNPILLLRFFAKKIFYNLGMIDFWTSNILYLIPFFTYLFYLIIGRKISGAYSTIKDYLSLCLIFFIGIEIVNQIIRIAGGQITSLQTLNNIFLSLLISLAVITASFKETD